MTVMGDGGVTDQTGAVMDAWAAGQPLGPGVIRVTEPLLLKATAVYSSGRALRGSPGFSTTILADYNGDPVIGGIIQIDTAATDMHTIGNVIEDLVLSPAPGRTGLNGIALTAAWFTSIKRVWCPNGLVAGIKIPWRGDLGSDSDHWQCANLDVEHCYIQQCSGNGMDFGGGQSPGGLRVAYCQSIQSAGIGLRITTGQCEIINNVLSYNGIGGMEVDTSVEGPSQQGLFAQNEIQDNQYWGVNMLQSRNTIFRQNRFLSQTYSGSSWATASPQNGGPFMRQFVHVNLGGAGPVYNFLAELNQHKSVNGPIATTAACYGYDAGSGTLSASFPSQFIKNEFGPWPPDGLTQNSTGFGKYVGISAPAGLITDP
jgi:hypothetical protein